MPVTTFNPSTVAAPPPYYNQVAVTTIPANTKLITLAGQVGMDPKTGETGKTYAEQVQLAYLNMANALEAAGASLRDIIHVRHYIVRDTGDAQLDALDIVDRGAGEEWVKLMDSKADGHRPPDTVLGVLCLAKKELLYEVEVWAVVSN